MKHKLETAILLVVVLIAGITIGRETSFRSSDVKKAFKEGYLMGMEKVVDHMTDQSAGLKYADLNVLSTKYLKAVSK